MDEQVAESRISHRRRDSGEERALSRHKAGSDLEQEAADSSLHRGPQRSYREGFRLSATSAPILRMAPATLPFSLLAVPTNRVMLAKGVVKAGEALLKLIPEPHTAV